MPQELKDVRRIESLTQQELTNTLKTKMLGVDIEKSKLGYKKASGDMLMFPSDGSDASFNSLTIEQLATGSTQNLGIDETGNVIIYNTTESGGSTVYDGNGVNTGMALYVGSPNNTFSITAGTYHKIGEGDVTYPGIENVPLTYLADINQTYVAIETATGNVIQSGSPFNPAQRRLLVILGVVVHTNNSSVNAINNLPDVAMYTLAQLNDFMDSMNALNIEGNVISAKGANLQIKKSYGEIFKRGSNFQFDPNDPHTKTMDSLDPVTNLRMRQYNGDESADRNTIDLKWENNGVLEPLSASRWGVYRVVLFPSNLIRIQYPQQQYQSMVEAQNAIQTETYITENNMKQNGLLRGFIIIKEGTTALNDTSKAKFIEADKFGYNIAGGAGGGVTTLQGAYNNSSEPEILTDDTRQALTLKKGGTYSGNVLEVKNSSDSVVANIDSAGNIVSEVGMRVAGASQSGSWLSETEIKVADFSGQALIAMSDDNGNGRLDIWSGMNGCTIAASSEALNITTGGADGLIMNHPHTTDLINDIATDPNPNVLVSRAYLEETVYPYDDVKDPTGFTDPAGITVSYDATTRKVTLSGTVKALWRGQVIDVLVSGWVSSAHDDTVGNWFLFYTGAQFLWSQIPWSLDLLMITEVFYGASVTNRFGVREVHGLMDFRTHSNLHYNIGTWRKSGGAFTVGSYTTGSVLDADRRPTLESSLVVDEDLQSVIPASSTGNYCQFYLTGAGVANYTVDQADIITDAGKFRYNLNTGGTWTTPVVANNSYGKIFVVNIPVTSDVGSQKFRTLYLMPQTVSLTLSTIQAITPSNYNWGAITGPGINEFVFVGEIIVQATSTDWVVTSVSTISGNRISQVTTPATTVTAQGVIDTIQTTDGFGAFKASNASVFTEGSNTHLYLGNVTSSNGIIDGNGSLVMVVDNDEISTTDAFYVRSRDADLGVTIFKVEQNENVTTGGVPSAPSSSNIKIDNVGTKALITKEYLDTKAVLTKTITIENPVTNDNFCIFRVDTAATILEINAVAQGNTPSINYTIKRGPDRSNYSGDIGSATVTSTSTVQQMTISNGALTAGDLISINLTSVGGTSAPTQVTIDIRYSMNS